MSKLNDEKKAGFSKEERVGGGRKGEKRGGSVKKKGSNAFASTLFFLLLCLH